MNRHLIIAGMQRSGTTWLYHVLDQHPQIKFTQSTRPEPKFFLTDENIDAGYAAYTKLFTQADHRFTGWHAEKSTSYSEFSELPQIINGLLQDAPDSRVLFIIRHPIDRAVSNIRFSQNSGLEDRSVLEALEQNLAGPARQLGSAGISTSVDPKAYLERGLYWQQIEPYLHVFDKERVKLLISEDTFGNVAAIKALFEWLGLEPTALLSVFSNPVNQSTRYRQTEDRLPDDLYQALLEYFRQPNIELAANTQLDLSAWSAE